MVQELDRGRVGCREYCSGVARAVVDGSSVDPPGRLLLWVPRGHGWHPRGWVLGDVGLTPRSVVQEGRALARTPQSSSLIPIPAHLQEHRTRAQPHRIRGHSFALASTAARPSCPGYFW